MLHNWVRPAAGQSWVGQGGQAGSPVQPGAFRWRWTCPPHVPTVPRSNHAQCLNLQDEWRVALSNGSMTFSKRPDYMCRAAMAGTCPCWFTARQNTYVSPPCWWPAVARCSQCTWTLGTGRYTCAVAQCKREVVVGFSVTLLTAQV